MKMHVLILGSGGREHALAWKIAQSPLLGELYIAPGNAGTAACGRNIALSPTDFESVGRFVLEHDIGMLVVGPEEPLVRGIADHFYADKRLRDIALIGPGRTGAMLEGSKEFAKRFMQRHGIPTAAYGSFTADTLEAGLQHLESSDPPYVLKADGLAAGKGVLILNGKDEAKRELAAMLTEGKFGRAGEKVVIEEHLRGIELSVFALTDGSSYVILPEAKDYKRIGEGDTGLNTGGMGAVSPVPFADAAFMQKVEERIIRKTVEGLREDGIPYRGFLFFGLMNVQGDPYVIEYNVRMGDPESEVVLPRIQNDLLEALIALSTNSLQEISFSFDSRSAATVMLVSGGYPGKYEKGKPVSGTEAVREGIVFHAGTALDDAGMAITNGGRVLALTSLADSMEEALAISYGNAERISFEGKQFRRDIGFDLKVPESSAR